MFDTLLINTLFLLASLLVCLLTLRLSINVKHLCLFFHSLPILTDFLKFTILEYIIKQYFMQNKRFSNLKLKMSYLGNFGL